MGLHSFRLAAMVLLAPLIAACSVAALDPGSGVDRTLTTSAIPTPQAELASAPPVPGADMLLAALAAAERDGKRLPIAWQDRESGVRGTVTALSPAAAGCRVFLTTRESFDGVSLYRGELCGNAGEGWRMGIFEPL